LPREYAGRYQRAEVPLTPLQYQYLDGAGAPLDISAHSSVTFLVTDPDGVTLSHAASIVAPVTGVVAVTWTSAMTAIAGQWESHFWLAPGPVASVPIAWVVIDGPGPGADTSATVGAPTITVG